MYVLSAREALTMRTCRPRWLVSKGRDAEALQTLAKLRRLATTDTRIQQEWFDIRAEVAFHKETSALRHPELQNRTVISRVKLEIVSWTDCFRRGCWRRTHVGVGIMFMQQYVIFLLRHDAYSFKDMRPFPLCCRTNIILLRLLINLSQSQ